MTSVVEYIMRDKIFFSIIGKAVPFPDSEAVGSSGLCCVRTIASSGDSASRKGHITKPQACEPTLA